MDESLDLHESSIDIDFSIPAKQRVRFTHDLARSDFDILLNVLEPGGDGPSRVMVVVDDELASGSERVHQLVASLCDSSAVEVVPAGNERGEGPIYRVPGGEQIKNHHECVDRLLAQIHDHGLDRRSYVLAIGGGAVLDAVGYAAAIAHRGVRLIRLPTTTLAQADSGVGVKNAINRFGKKNWVGTFVVPWAVINDAALLETLPDREFRCGFSESVKVSLLKSSTDFEWLFEHAHRIAERDMAVAFPAIGKSCRWHLRHITQGGDPFESREARPLDFGHWSAHRMESMSDYDLRHGEAVGIGVALDCIYSSLVHGLPESAATRVCQCIHRLGIALDHPTLDDTDGLLSGLEEFRQHLGGRLTLTMLRDVGKPLDVHEVDTSIMRRAIDQLRNVSAELGLQESGNVA
ncbi:MAG: 3-dehydroquinate synthase [Planctomycetota bacterium]